MIGDIIIVGASFYAGKNWDKIKPQAIAMYNSIRDTLKG